MMRTSCFITVFLLLLISSLGAYNTEAQTYKSLDDDSQVKSIQIVSPTGTYWKNPTDFRILLIDDDVDNSSVGGKKSNPRKRAILFTKQQLLSVSSSVASKGELFIARIPAYSMFWVPELQSDAAVLEKINGALFVHNLSLQKHPEMSVYEYCDSRACPDEFSHDIVVSFQITKSGSKFIMIFGSPMNAGGTPIPWKISNLGDRTYDETIVELTESQYNALFN